MAAILVGILVVKSTTKEAWDTIKVMRMDVGRVRESTAQKLRKEFEAIAFKDDESIDVFEMWMVSPVNNLRTLKDTIEDEKCRGSSSFMASCLDFLPK